MTIPGAESRRRLVATRPTYDPPCAASGLNIVRHGGWHSTHHHQVQAGKVYPVGHYRGADEAPEALSSGLVQGVASSSSVIAEASSEIGTSPVSVANLNASPAYSSNLARQLPEIIGDQDSVLPSVYVAQRSLVIEQQAP